MTTKQILKTAVIAIAIAAFLLLALKGKQEADACVTQALSKGQRWDWIEAYCGF